MTQEITSLVLAVDSTSAVSAAGALDKMATAGGRAETAASRLEKQFASMLDDTASISAGVAKLVQLADAANSATTAAARVAPKLEESSRSMVQASARFLEMLQRQGDAIGRTEVELMAMRAAELGVADAAAPLIKRIEQLTAAEVAQAAVLRESAAAAKAMENIRIAAQDSQRKQFQTQQQFVQSLQQEADAIGKSRAELLAYRAAQLGVSEQAAPLIDRIGKASQQQTGFRQGLKLSAYEAQQLSFQLNDLFVQIASGQSPVTALIQQGSQLSGTFGGLRGTFSAVTSLFTVGRVVIGATAAAAAALGYALYEGAQQSRDFEKAITLTGNAAGLTQGKFEALVHTIAAATNTTVGSSRDTMQALVATGLFTGEALTQAATAAQTLSKATGQSTDDIIKDFSNMTGGVARWAEATNRGYHFLTAAQLDYIKTLEQQGRSQDAIVATMQALNTRTTEATQNVGLFAAAWAKTKSVIDSVREALAAIGRDQTVEDNIDSLTQKIAQAEEKLRNVRPGLQNNGLMSLGDFMTADQIDTMKESLRLLKQQKADTEGLASVRAADDQRQQSRIRFNTLLEQSMTRQQQLTKALADANALADASGASAAERAKVLADIRTKMYVEPPKSSLADDVAVIQRSLNSIVDSYQNGDAILEALRAARIVSEKDYYNQKRALLTGSEQAEVSALEDQIRRVKDEKIVGKDAIEIQNKRAEQLRQIADLEEKIDRTHAQAGAKRAVLDIQQGDAVDRVKRSYLDARAAAQQYLDTIGRQNQRSLDDFSRGDKARERSAGLNQIDDRYQAQRDLLQSERLRNAITQEQFDSQLALIEEFHKKASAQWDDYYAELAVKQGDWVNGASRAMALYQEEADNVAKFTEDSFTRAFGNAEDALVSFVTTGKADFKSLITSIIADMVRLEARQSLASGLGALFSFLGGGSGLSIDSSVAGNTGGITSDTTLPDELRGGRALGGPVSSGGVYPVAERGIETLTVSGKKYLMMGSQNGTVTPGGGAPVHNHYYSIEGAVSRNDVATYLALSRKEFEGMVDAKIRKASR